MFVKPNFVEATPDEINPYDTREEQFIFVGRLDKLKGIDILFEAWKQMNRTAPKLVVCGTGPMEEWCRKFLVDYPDRNIEMRGFVPNKEAKKLIANSRALILLTQGYEGFPMTIVEAFSVGTPVIGSRSILNDEENGWTFDYRSIDALCKAVIRSHNIVNQVVKYRKQYGYDTNYNTLSYIYNNCVKWGQS